MVDGEVFWLDAETFEKTEGDSWVFSWDQMVNNNSFAGIN